MTGTKDRERDCRLAPEHGHIAFCPKLSMTIDQYITVSTASSDRNQKAKCGSNALFALL